MKRQWHNRSTGRRAGPAECDLRVGAMVQVAQVLHFPRSPLPGIGRREVELSEVAPGRVSAAGSERPTRVQDSFILSQLELFDRINLAATVVNRDERIVRLNRRCERVLGSGLRLQRERFVARHRRSNEQLRNAMQAVFSNQGTSRPVATQGVIASDWEPPIFFRALPLGRSCSDDRPLFALLLFCSPATQPIQDTKLLSRAFGLTPAQARVAGNLATGASIDAVAARLGIKKETARNHLKQIFLKTGTRRQGALVALLSSFWFGAPEDCQASTRDAGPVW